MAEGSLPLAESHRLAQRRLGNQTMRLLERVFPLLDLADISSTEAAWMRPNLVVLARQHGASSQLAADYLRAARALDLGPDPTFQPVRAAFNARRATAALHSSGPAHALRLVENGQDGATLRGRVLESVLRSGARQAMAGGRDTSTATLAADSEAIGWQRIGSGTACAFCSTLISRGPVYTQESGGFQAHDGCSCGVGAIYDPANEWTAQAQQLRDEWDEVTEGLSGRDAINAFRRHLGHN